MQQIHGPVVRKNRSGRAGFLSPFVFPRFHLVKSIHGELFERSASIGLNDARELMMRADDFDTSIRKGLTRQLQRCASQSNTSAASYLHYTLSVPTQNATIHKKCGRLTDTTGVTSVRFP